MIDLLNLLTIVIGVVVLYLAWFGPAASRARRCRRVLRRWRF